MYKGRVIFNPAAGQVATKKMISRAAEELEKNGWRVEVVSSRSGTHTGELARGAAQAEMDAVFVAGGDGSVRAVLEGLLDSRTALGVLPAGSMNVWARELGLPRLTRLRRKALVESAARLANGRVQVMDVGMCGHRPFLLWAGAGLDGVITNQMEGQREGRRHFPVPKYLATAVWKAGTWKGMDLEINVDGKIMSGHYMFVVMANIRSYAGGFSVISPHAILDDGEMDLWLFSGDSMQRALQHAWGLLSGNHVRSEEVEYIKFRELQMKAEEGLMLQLDGDPFEAEGSLNVKVMPAAIRVLVPQNLPHTLFSQAGTALK